MRDWERDWMRMYQPQSEQKYETKRISRGVDSRMWNLKHKWKICSRKPRMESKWLRGLMSDSRVRLFWGINTYSSELPEEGLEWNYDLRASPDGRQAARCPRLGLGPRVPLTGERLRTCPATRDRQALTGAMPAAPGAAARKLPLLRPNRGPAGYHCKNSRDQSISWALSPAISSLWLTNRR